MPREKIYSFASPPLSLVLLANFDDDNDVSLRAIVSDGLSESATVIDLPIWELHKLREKLREFISEKGCWDSQYYEKYE